MTTNTIYVVQRVAAQKYFLFLNDNQYKEDYLSKYNCKKSFVECFSRVKTS